MHAFLYRIAKWLVRWGSKLFVRVKIQGLEHAQGQGAYLLCGNHLSWFDGAIILLLPKKRIVRLMCKKELFSIFPGRWFYEFAYFFPVDREGNDVQSVKTALKVLKDGHVLGIFPEGTRSKSQELLPFHNGPVTLAHRQKVPIVPFGRTKKVGLWGKICVSIGVPYYIDCDDRRLSQEQTERFTQELREKVMEEMEKAERMLHG